MITLLLILTAASGQLAQGPYPVRWTSAVGPASRQALEAKVKAPVKKLRRSKIYLHLEGEPEIRTCSDYARALKDGWSESINNYEIAIESFFKEQCDVPWLLLAARPSRVSYVRGFKLDEHALDLIPPPSQWSSPGVEDVAEGKGLSWKQQDPELKVTGKKVNEITVESEGDRKILEIKGFGDFNGDGIEDVLLFEASYSIGGSGRYYTPVILTRLAPGGPIKVFEVGDDAIQKAAAKVIGTRRARRHGKQPQR
jgi:hypothetical protein